MNTSRLEEDEYEIANQDIDERGGFLHERSILNIGFLFGLGFAAAQAIVGGIILGIAVALGVI